MKSKTHHRLAIHDLSLQVKLGWTPEERAVRQEIRVSFEIRFALAPKGTKSDLLEDTFCYGKISEAISQHCKKREFKLIEKLTADLVQVVRDQTKNKVKISLTVLKVNPPVPGLLGGASYSISDFL